MRIVLDTMGSDQCPVPDVEGAIQAARAGGVRNGGVRNGGVRNGGVRDSGSTIILVGDKQAIERELAKYDTEGLGLEVVHASQAITMSDSPSQVARLKPDSSMMVGLNLVKEGKADAFVSAGNTGAVLALATLSTLRRIRGVRRPTLTALIPLPGKTFIMTDLGANADARPDWLVQFAIMGSLYAERVMGREKPRVALLSNGEEEGKGSILVRETVSLLEHSSLNFVGNVEPRDMLNGTADVVVTDGFVGNITLKTIEAMGITIFGLMREAFSANLRARLGALIALPALRSVRKILDPFEVGGAPLLGVNGVVIIAHGRSNANGIKNAIFQAQRAVNGKIIDAIREGMADYENEEGSDTPTTR